MISSNMKSSIVISHNLDTERMLEPGRGDIDTRRLEPVCELGPNSGCRKGANHTPIGRYTVFFKNENVLHADDFFFHASDLRHVSDAPGSVVEPGNLHDQLNSRGDLAPDCFLRQVQIGHH